MDEIPSWNGSVGQRRSPSGPGDTGHGQGPCGPSRRWGPSGPQSNGVGAGNLDTALVEDGFPRCSGRMDERMKGWDRVLVRLCRARAVVLPSGALMSE